MLLIHNLTRPPFRGAMAVAMIGLGASLFVDIHTSLPLLCSATDDPPWSEHISASLTFVRATNSVPGLTIAWGAMLAGMMTPLTAQPLAYVRLSSLASRRARAAAAFLLGYFAVWVLAGAPLLGVALLLRVATGSAAAALTAVSMLALIWSASPLQRRAQNRAHRLRRIGLYGLSADRDCLIFGAALGSWCLASCWLWMLVPLFVSRGHFFAMAIVAAIVLAERLRGPGVAEWQVPLVLVLPLAWLQSVMRDCRGEKAGYV